MDFGRVLGLGLGLGLEWGLGGLVGLEKNVEKEEE